MSIVAVAQAQGNQKLDAAVSQYQTDMAALFTEDGKPVYSQEIHASRISEIKAAFQTASDEVYAMAETFVQTADETLLLEELDSVLDLLPTELNTASQAAPLVRDACMDMPIDELTKRLRAVTVHGEKMQKILYSRYAEVRLRQLDDGIKSEYETGTAPSSKLEGLGAFRQVVNELRASCTFHTPARKKLIDDARRDKEAAGQWRITVNQRRYDVLDAESDNERRRARYQAF